MPRDARILVVDDEAPLLKLLETYLGKLGFTVTGVSSGEEAIRVFKAAPTEFEVLVADLTLGNMPGDEVAIELMRLNPQLRVLLLSGYPYDLEVLPDELRSRTAFVQKPFAPAVLSAAIDQLLST